MNAFTLNGVTTTISGSTTSADGAVNMTGKSQILVTNASSVVAYIRSGIGSLTAVTTDTPILPTSAQTFTIPANHNRVAAILASGTGNVHFTVGTGL